MDTEELSAREEQLWRLCGDRRWPAHERDLELLAVDRALGLADRPAPFRLTFAGDWHGNWPFARSVLQHASVGGAEAVIQLGDFGVWPGEGRYLTAVAREAREHDLVVYFVDGNHDDPLGLESYPLRPDGVRVVRPRLYHLPRGHRWTWEGIRFAALGGATSLDRHARTAGLNWWPREEATDADVWVCCNSG